MESVLWAFKSLWDKGLVYEGFRVLWYCWRCETPLSKTETRMDDVYKERKDPAVTVGLKLETEREGLAGAEAVVWTTTPWTLPSNLAAAVHPEVDYVVVEAQGSAAAREAGGPDAAGPATAPRRYLLAEARVPAYAREHGEDPPVISVLLRHLHGSELRRDPRADPADQHRVALDPGKECPWRAHLVGFHPFGGQPQAYGAGDPVPQLGDGAGREQDRAEGARRDRPPRTPSRGEMPTRS